ncbi:Electron transport complex subunit RsxC [Candidatus Erwinia haradaeae]|uniref:Ion-translocating oxidoreductase complex subunit C n=1 Tax=Candidatus Erwinia haradaeae TaxID=1922217 RepID=A0A451DIQ7_9GAMM|nr:electron transport complex subunit RsxC [Candidatus Erwinia haradaeae]VFP86589.1 Electron transport complex subunit RsxC [Candidatus Erwinia haradaeae]
MFHIFKKNLKKTQLWDFHGGIHPLDMKSQSSHTPVRKIPLPPQLILPLRQHIGTEGEVKIQPGDRVLRGQALTHGNGSMLPVHAPTSGIVTKITPHVTAHASLLETCIFITPDGEDKWLDRETFNNYRYMHRSEILKIIHDAGIAGLGGAGFPTAYKLKSGLQKINTLIINAVECEPYITADDRLMQDHPLEVLEGIRILAWILRAHHIIIGIEDNKPKAILSLQRALQHDMNLSISIRIIPTKYPSGNSGHLIKILTGKEVPHNQHSSEIGVFIQNVSTAFAVKRAIIDGESLTERVVTLTGASLSHPGNVWARLGTPVNYLLKHAGFNPEDKQLILMGGALMGLPLLSDAVPVVKITNCILAPTSKEGGINRVEKNCIRCGICSDVCPVSLLPQQLYWFIQGGDHNKARAHNVIDCIECGACSYVCPSNIPLVQYYRKEKEIIQALDADSQRSRIAKTRFEARNKRLLQKKNHTQKKLSPTVNHQPNVIFSQSLAGSAEITHDSDTQT